MSLGGKLISLFPALFTLLILSEFIWFIKHPNLINFFIILSSLYLIPVFLFRIHKVIFSKKSEIIDLSKKEYSQWWGGYQLQLIYNTFPFIEAPLHFFPGLYSAWLRLWGSRIGKNIYWTARSEVVDRDLLEFGDNIVVGNLTIFFGHIISPLNGKPMLLIKKIHLKDNVFVGAESRIGPGVVVEKGTKLKAKTLLYWKGEYKV